MSTNIFEYASRHKLRYATGVNPATISTEDLWQLPLTGGKCNLDSVAKLIARDIRAAEEESFVSTSKASLALRTKLDVVKHIISIRITEKEARENRAVMQEEVSLIDSVLEKKRAEKYDNLSIEELEAAKEAL